VPVNIRVMNWNIEQLSWNKIQIAGMATAIAEVVVAANVDILVVVEVKLTKAVAIMTNLTAAITLQAAGPAYYWLLSMGTGGERYGFVIRDVNTIRPLQFVANPNAPAPTDGTSNHPFTDLRDQVWTTWPLAFPAPAPAPLPAPPPRMGLIDAFATPSVARTVKRINFGGQRIGAGGYSLGRGYRMPCLALFMVQGPAAVTLVPIVVCHYAAVRSGRNVLGQQQIAQLNLLNIAQLFSFYDLSVVPLPAPVRGYLDVDNAANTVTNIIYTGDFNVDFLQNQAGGTFLANLNHDALLSLTPTQQQGGSAPPPPATAGAVPVGMVPAIPFVAFLAAPVVTNIPSQTLRAACTTQGTILNKLPTAMPAPPPATTLLLRGAAFDNFFYGGAEPNAAVVNSGTGAVDAGEIIDVPANLQQPGAGGGLPNLSVAALQAHYALAGTKKGALAPNLAGAFGVAPALTNNDRWIGARLISDHLPAILQFACP
jgi:hypothetical protein